MMEIHPERTPVLDRKPRLIFPVAIWAIALVLMIGGALMLSGCATTFQGLCAVKPIGQNENGHTVLATYCEAAK
jgi:hypothetical protein